MNRSRVPGRGAEAASVTVTVALADVNAVGRAPGPSMSRTSNASEPSGSLVGYGINAASSRNNEKESAAGVNGPFSVASKRKLINVLKVIPCNNSLKKSASPIMIGPGTSDPVTSP